MNMLGIAIYIVRMFSKINNPLFKLSKYQQLKILESFKIPVDLIECSYFQFKCQVKTQLILLNIFQYVSAIIFLPYIIFKHRKDGENRGDKENSKYVTKISKNNVAVFISSSKNKRWIPNSLYNTYKKIIYVDYYSKKVFGLSEKKFFNTIIKRYWYQPYFCVKSLIKIMIYAYQIKTYNPSTIITSTEYSFTSSLLTSYCDMMGVNHINVMHGEKLFFIRDSFVQFHQNYVWDEYYVDLFCTLKSNKNQFIVEKPDALKLNIKYDKRCKYDITYYLGNENKKELYNIKSMLVNSKFKKNKICVRMHPIYGDVRLINMIFKDFVIQNPKNVCIDESISITKYVVSLYSTVLNQAYENNKEIIIDDISNIKKYKSLCELDYIILKKRHLLMSSYKL